ncbi:MAG: flavin-containing monooxygenase [Acidimicrobiales bacterium]
MAAVGILGAGLSGVLMGMQVRRAGLDDFVIYEREADVGGTWLRNTYPGLHCDVPSHLYSYSFEPNPNWSMTYAGQAEIQAYVRACAEKYGLIEHIRFGETVERAVWEDGDGAWRVETAAGEAAAHRVLVAATGGLTAPNLPRLDGLERFAGPSWHSGAWRHDVDLAGRRVAVIGSAASAVQVAPEAAKTAAALHVFSRTPNWILPRGNRFYSEAEREALLAPQHQRRLRRSQYREALLWYGAFKRRRRAQDRIRELCLTALRASIEDPDLVAALTPDYEPGCKRILVCDEYYPTLALPHVRLVPHAVTGLTADGVLSADGAHTPVDVVIFCTGYKLGGRAEGGPAVEVVGRGGERLRDALRRSTEAYRGVAVPGFPNYFTVCGVNGTVAYGALISSAEAETEFITGWVRRLTDGGVKSVEARRDVTERYNAQIQLELAEMSWTGGCPNFYLDRAGRVVAFYPGTLGRLRRELREADPEELVVAAW